MTLREYQSLFVRLLPRLIDFAYSQGYEMTIGEALRTPEQAALNAAKGSGISNSLHLDKLAIDLNLFIGGEYQQGTQAHRPLGEFWERQHPLCRWGGRILIPHPDGNHYSLSPDHRR